MNAMPESSRARLRSSVSSPGMPKTYSTPSASRHSTNKSAALRSFEDIKGTFATPTSVGCLPNVRPASLAMKTRSALLSLALLCALAPSAQAASRLTIRGAGFGHGVGMSQWGAYGYAMHGATYRDILGHYYTGTSIGATGSRTVRVLLMPSVARAHFSGATAAAGRALNPGTTYGVRRGRTAGTVDLLSPTGRRMKRVSGILRVTGPGVVTLGGAG